MTQTPGISIITERIFESRFTHVQEMERLGAEISIEGPSAIVHGVQKLSGAEIMASDLRASAALVIARMVAEGTTQVNRIYHLDRGYEKLDTKLEKLGAKIRKAELDKVPNIIIVGPKEAEEGNVSVRSRFDGDRGIMSRNAFKTDLLEMIQSRKLQIKS